MATGQLVIDFGTLHDQAGAPKRNGRLVISDAVGNFARTTPVRRAMIAAQQARSTLEAGVTSVRDLGSSHGIAIDLRDAISAGLT